MSARSLFGLSVVVLVAVLVWAGYALPDRVPVHFGLTGEADRFTSRPRALAELGLVVALLAAAFAGSAALARRGPLALVNVPHKDYWTRPEHEAELRRRLGTDVWVLGALTMLLVAGVTTHIVRVAEDADPRFGVWGWTWVAVYLAAVLGYSAFVLVARYRPERA